MDHVRAQRQFYKHLCMHPGAHRAARAFAHKISAKDPAAMAALKDLASRAAADESAANALRIIAVTMKFEKIPVSAGPMMAGGVPAQVFHTTGKLLKLALSPAAWALHTGGKAFHWAGVQLQHLSHAI